MTKPLHILFLLGAVLLINSCYYDVEEDLYPTLECKTTGVTYTATVLPILQQNCLVCHNAQANFGNVTLQGYDNLMRYVNSGQLLGAIKHQPGFSPMPNNAPKLRECDIAKIEQWVADGALEN